MRCTGQYFRALADETRLRLLALLLNAGESCVCNLTAALQLPQPTVSRHLSYLKNSGWVCDRRVGVWIFYSVAGGNEMQKELADVLRTRLAELPVVVEDLKRLRRSADEVKCA